MLAVSNNYLKMCIRDRSNTVLLITTDHQSLTVKVNDKIIYKFSTVNVSDFGNYFGRSWNLVEIPENRAGEKIEIIAESMTGSHLLSLDNFFCGNRSSVIGIILTENIRVAVFCSVTLIL